MKDYWLAYKDEDEAVEHLTALGVISNEEEFKAPLDVQMIGHMPIFSEVTEDEEPKLIGQTAYLVNCWGNALVDFGEYSKPRPKTPFYTPFGL